MCLRFFLNFPDVLNMDTLSPYSGSQGNMSASSPTSTSLSPVYFSPEEYVNNLNNVTGIFVHVTQLYKNIIQSFYYVNNKDCNFFLL